MTVRRGRTLFVALAIGALLLAWPRAAVVVGDAEAGTAKAAVCAACHGRNGISANRSGRVWWVAGSVFRQADQGVLGWRTGGRVDVAVRFELDGSGHRGSGGVLRGAFGLPLKRLVEPRPSRRDCRSRRRWPKGGGPLSFAASAYPRCAPGARRVC